MIPDPVVFVVDDDEAVRESIRKLLSSVGLRAQTFGSTTEFLSSTRPEAPGCLVLDVRLPDVSGLEFQRALSEADTQIPIIFITGHADIPMTVQAMKAGAVDFLEKPVTRETLLEAIRRALAGDALKRVARDEAQLHHARLNALTIREREVFDRIVDGKLNKQIADELGIGLRTVKAYRAQLMIKLGVSSAAELGRLAGLQKNPSNN